MIVVDGSALICLLLAESDALSVAQALVDAERRLLSAVSRLEAGLVLAGRFGPAGPPRLVELLEEIAAEVVPFDDAQAQLATEAFLRFGKGRHPAKLNFGDCAAYALAKSRNLPLLFKGGDFGLTDVRPAV